MDQLIEAHSPKTTLVSEERSPASEVLRLKSLRSPAVLEAMRLKRLRTIQRQAMLKWRTNARLMKTLIQSADPSPVCCFCLETHVKADCVFTQCGHSFGRACYEEFRKNNGQNVFCTLCKAKNPILK